MAVNTLTHSVPFSSISASRTDIRISTLTIVVASIFLFLTVIFVVLLYFYVKYHWGSRSARRLPHLIFAAAGNPLAPNRGLDPAVLSSLPITLYKPSDFKDGIECAVCLSELAAGEEARLLPKCSHGFHLECIDMWFQSNSTCPVCRCAIEDDGGRSAAKSDSESESPDLPTNVLFWGNRNGVDRRRVDSGSSGSSERALVISIPVRPTEGFLSPLASSRTQVEDMKSSVEDRRSPATPKMWSLRRILSRGKRAGGSSNSSPRIGDIEQGFVGSGAENGEGSSSKSPTSSL